VSDRLGPGSTRTTVGDVVGDAIASWQRRPRRQRCHANIAIGPFTPWRAWKAGENAGVVKIGATARAGNPHRGDWKRPPPDFGRLRLVGFSVVDLCSLDAVELVDLRGLSSKEAAGALGVSPGTLRMRLSRARSRESRRGLSPARRRPSRMVGCQ